MLHHLRVWAASARYSIIRTLMFRGDFLVWSLVELFWMSVNLLLIAVIAGVIAVTQAQRKIPVQYAQRAIDAGVAFVNNIPVFIASNPEWAAKFEAAGVPIIGDEAVSIEGGSGALKVTPGHDPVDFEIGQRHDRVDQTPVVRLLGAVLTARVPDLARALLADRAREQTGAVATVERAHARTGLAEAGVVGGDAQIAHDVQHMATPDGVARYHRDDGLGDAADRDLQIQDVESAHTSTARGFCPSCCAATPPSTPASASRCARAPTTRSCSRCWPRAGWTAERAAVSTRSC